MQQKIDAQEEHAQQAAEATADEAPNHILLDASAMTMSYRQREREKAWISILHGLFWRGRLANPASRDDGVHPLTWMWVAVLAPKNKEVACYTARTALLDSHACWKSRRLSEGGTRCSGGKLN